LNETLSPPRSPALRQALLWAVLAASVFPACLGRRPVLAPPSEEVSAVEGFGQARIEGDETALKGRFSFLFRNPDLGRLDVLDPIGRTAYFIIVREGSAHFVVPSKRIYAVEPIESLAGQLLGFPFRPGEAVSLLCDRWSGREAGPDSPGWTLVTDSGGRTIGGRREGLSFEVRDFFGKAGVPRAVDFSDGRISGRIKILSVRFNPLPRPEAFDTGFSRVFVRLSWEELEELLKE